MRTLSLAALVPACLVATTAFAAWPSDPTVNLPVCTAPSSQSNPEVVSDGAGGMLAVWADSRPGATGVYVQHVLATGIVDPAWPVNGRALNPNLGNSLQPQLVSDGAGGAVVAWTEQRVDGGDLYALHVQANGVVDPAWPANGRALCTAANTQNRVRLLSDGAGGALACWLDLRGGVQSDVYATHVKANGTLDAAYPANGRPLVAAAGDRNELRVTSDGSGGLYATWTDVRAGNSDVYAQHLITTGLVDPLWPPAGLGLGLSSANSDTPRPVGDGIGGVFVVWTEARGATGTDVYVQHAFSNGALDPAFVLDGTVLCNRTGPQFTPVVASDGAGGLCAAWSDLSSGFPQVFAGHLRANGTVDPVWPVGGRAVSPGTASETLMDAMSDGAGGLRLVWVSQGATADLVRVAHVLANSTLDPEYPAAGATLGSAPGIKSDARILSDGASGAIALWRDQRIANNIDLYAQRIADHALLGSPEALLTSVLDSPGDNGGFVDVVWLPSPLESVQPPLPVSYSLYRSVSPAVALARLARSERARTVGELPASQGEILVQTSGTTTFYWELLVSLNAAGFPLYNAHVNTASDSVAGSNPLTHFMVQTRNGVQSWNSPPLSGYSVDNLPPLEPTGLLGVLNGSSIILDWVASFSGDRSYYRIYRGATAGFVPGPANLLATTTATHFVTTANASPWYKVSTVDIHGNESPFATVQPTASTGVGGSPLALALAPPVPRPARNSASLAFTLPVASHARLSVLDVSGRRVRVLAEGVFAAGTQRVPWDLRSDDAKAMPPGQYFVRLEAMGQVRTERMEVVR